jgi:pimeloyl-ACP methyl ester carboxylesterase
MRARLYALRVPRAFLFGERSLPDPELERLASQGIDVLVVPKAGHDMPFDNPAGLAEITAQALEVKSRGA